MIGVFQSKPHLLAAANAEAADRLTEEQRSRAAENAAEKEQKDKMRANEKEQRDEATAVEKGEG